MSGAAVPIVFVILTLAFGCLENAYKWMTRAERTCLVGMYAGLVIGFAGWLVWVA